MAFAKKKLKKHMRTLALLEDTAKAALDQGTIKVEAYEELISAGLRDKRVEYDEWGDVIVEATVDIPPTDEVPNVDEAPVADEAPDVDEALVADEAPVADDGTYSADSAERVSTPADVRDEKTAEQTKPKRDAWESLTGSASDKDARGRDLGNKEQKVLSGDSGLTTEICARGGIVLIMCSGNGEEHSLVVSGSILQAASSVMADKIRDLSWLKRKTGERLRLELLDEDKEVMEVVCNAIHFHTHQLPIALSPGGILRNGRTSEKYNFKEALRPWSTIWLLRALVAAKQEELATILEAARLLDAWEEYSHISFEMARVQLGPFGHGKGIAADSIGYLEERRLGMITWVTGAIDEAMSSLVSGGTGVTSKVRMAWAQSVKDHRLWPAAVQMREFSVEQTLEAMERFREPAHMLGAGEACGCREPTLDMARKFQVFRQELYEERVGVCLDCVVSRGESAEKGRCRLGSWRGKVKDVKAYD